MRQCVLTQYKVGPNRNHKCNPVPVPVPGFVTGTRNGTRLCHWYPNRYQALSPEPEPVAGSVTGTRTANRYQALSMVPEPVPGFVTGTVNGTRLCHRYPNQYQDLSPEPEPLPEPVKWEYDHNFYTSPPLTSKLNRCK